MTGVEKGFVVMMDGHVAEMYQLKRSVDEKLMMALNARSPQQQQQQQLSNPGPLLPLPRLLLIGPHNGYMRPLPYGIYQQGPRPPYSAAAGQVPFPFCLNWLSVLVCRTLVSWTMLLSKLLQSCEFVTIKRLVLATPYWGLRMHQLTANNSSARCTFGSVRAWLPEPHPIIQVDLHVEHGVWSAPHCMEDTRASLSTRFLSISAVPYVSYRSVILTCWTAVEPSTALCVLGESMFCGVSLQMWWTYPLPSTDRAWTRWVPTYSDQWTWRWYGEPHEKGGAAPHCRDSYCKMGKSLERNSSYGLTVHEEMKERSTREISTVRDKFTKEIEIQPCCNMKTPCLLYHLENAMIIFYWWFILYSCYNCIQWSAASVTQIILEAV